MRSVYDQIPPTSDASSDIGDVVLTDAGLATDAESGGASPAGPAGVIYIASWKTSERTRQAAKQARS